jgi:hypothetical protein
VAGIVSRTGFPLQGQFYIPAKANASKSMGKIKCVRFFAAGEGAFDTILQDPDGRGHKFSTTDNVHFPGE